MRETEIAVNLKGTTVASKDVAWPRKDDPRFEERWIRGANFLEARPASAEALEGAIIRLSGLPD